MKILMVCLGNICRSPLAEGILQHKIQQQINSGNKQFETWKVDSAGTSGFHSGEKPDRRSIKIAKENGIDVSEQRSRQFNTRDFEAFDVIYVMDSSNYRNVIALAKTNEEKAKVKLIMNEFYPKENINVPDPYYGEYGFENVFEMLDNACNEIMEKQLP